MHNYEQLVAFLREEGLPEPVPDHAELTYVNHIRAAGADGNRQPIEEHIRLWVPGITKSSLPTSEAVSLKSQYIIEDGTDVVARLYIEAESRVFKADGSQLHHLQLFARGALLQNKSFDAAVGFLDRAHAWIVTTFRDITTKEMHKEWKLTR